MNDDELDVRSGDMIRLNKMKVNKYNDYPQLVGNPDKCSMVVFRHNRNFVTGLPEPVEDVEERPKQFGTKTFTEPGSRLALKHKVAFASADQWKFIAYFPNFKFSSKDVEILGLFCAWAEGLFSHMSLADTNLPHSSLHHVLSHLHGRLHSATYAAMEPAVNPIFSNARAAPLATQRCDVVCMVVGCPEAAESSSSSAVTPASLLLWDGSTAGMLSLSGAPLHQTERIHSSLSAATEFSRCSTAPDFAAAKGRIADEPPQSSSTTQYLGSALQVRAFDASLNGFLAKFRPGMWVRVRNLHLDGGPLTSGGDNSVFATIHSDTHVCLLYPYFRSAFILF